MTAGCELAAFLRAAGPVRAPLRPCCLVALFDGAGRAAIGCAAGEPERSSVGGGALAVAGAEVPSGEPEAEAGPRRVSTEALT